VIVAVATDAKSLYMLHPSWPRTKGEQVKRQTTEIQFRHIVAKYYV